MNHHHTIQQALQIPIEGLQSCVQVKEAKEEGC